MKSTFRILVLAMVILLVTSAPMRHRAVAALRPVTSRVDTALAVHYPELAALRVMLVHWSRIG